MNREIKFRVWGEANGMTTWEDDRYNVCELIADKKNGRILMQYTGLKDKNGKEIYEGDVLEFWTFISMSEGVKKVSYVKEDGGIYVFPMLYHDNSYYLCDAIWISNKLEKGVFVIGNIYENPELITNL